ncbi:BamA/OMP85 family outer membrane protein [Singulisphaera sp. PoT]|uniref:BamA/OMP85 family outer membrane protein n=1 Tax=Singulisphaera sp. PoT TaxID=3411797 RepID=UPI003BF611B7
MTRSSAACLFFLALLGSLLVPARPSSGAADAPLPEGIVDEIKVEGNVTITQEQVRSKLLSKVNHPLDRKQIDADIKSLHGTKWFSNVEVMAQKSPKGKGFYILIFKVHEMPVITHVEFIGLKHLRLKEVQETTGLQKGKRADATRTRLAVGQIQRLYVEKGYESAEVYLQEGGNPGDTKVVIRIFEGPKYQVKHIEFRGNVFATSGQLRTKITSRTPILTFGGKFHRDNLDEDVRKLVEYYQGQGFFEVKVTPVTRTGSSIGDVQITYVISEGVQYKLRNILFEGNKKLSTANLKKDMFLKPAQPVLETQREADRKNLVSKYNEIGCIDTQILPEVKFTDQPGVVDMVYKIEEGEPYLLGELIIRGNERTKDRVLRREADMAALLPGQVLNLNRIELFKSRLANTQYFVTSPELGKPIEVKIINRRPGDKPYGDGVVPLSDESAMTRMQSPLDDLPGLPPATTAPATNSGRSTGSSSTLTPFGAGGEFDPPKDVGPIELPTAPPPPIPPTLPAAPGSPPTTPPVGAGEPPGMEPSLPGMNMTDVGPDRQDPFPNRSFADVVTSVSEAPTGRFMLGVGASGWQGLNGSLTISEKNFDLFAVPRSFEDIANGKAFRGAGQNFQMSLMVGTLINRATVSLSNPYLFDLPIGGSSSGYIFQRSYPDWSETRGGGRFSLGRQFGTSTYADVAFRVEDVNFYGYRTPAPADYLAASGHTFLTTLRPTLRFDNRNSPFMPNKGQYLEFAFEQGWGSFTYPKVELEGRTYFTTGTRPDGSGPRILALRGHLGFTGHDTPVYERFFAGYYGSLRGFQYRGVGPHVDDVNIGGIMMAVGSIEYMFPLSANDMFRQTVFCDFGTVENSYDFNNFRASVGTGLRIQVPQFGPMPLSFDLAFPVAKANGDKVNYFNFSVGAFY